MTNKTNLGKESHILKWKYNENYPMLEAPSPAAPGGIFRVFYHDITY